MRYSAAATAKYKKAYRWEQTKEAAYVCVVLGSIFLVGAYLIRVYFIGRAYEAHGVEGTLPRYATVTVARTGLVRRHAHNAVSFAGVEGRTVTFEGTNGGDVFLPGKKARIRYRVGRSGTVYVEKAEPLP